MIESLIAFLSIDKKKPGIFLGDSNGSIIFDLDNFIGMSLDDEMDVENIDFYIDRFKYLLSELKEMKKEKEINKHD